MSRIGKKPVKIPEGVTISLTDSELSASGPKGTLTMVIRPEVRVVQEGNSLIVERKAETGKAKSLHGLTRTLVENELIGVSAGWNKGLELVGVGYRAEVSGTNLVLNVGFSHPVTFPAPTGITFEVTENTKIKVRVS